MDNIVEAKIIEGKISKDKQLFHNDGTTTPDQDQAYLHKLNHLKQRGRIELIVGPMFAGKSTELLRRVKRLQISGKKCLNIKFQAD